MSESEQPKREEGDFAIRESPSLLRPTKPNPAPVRALKVSNYATPRQNEISLFLTRPLRGIASDGRAEEDTAQEAAEFSRLSIEERVKRSGDYLGYSEMTHQNFREHMAARGLVFKEKTNVWKCCFDSGLVTGSLNSINAGIVSKWDRAESLFAMVRTERHVFCPATKNAVAHMGRRQTHFDRKTMVEIYGERGSRETFARIRHLLIPKYFTKLEYAYKDFDALKKLYLARPGSTLVITRLGYLRLIREENTCEFVLEDRKSVV